MGLGLVGLIAWWLLSGRNNDAPVPIAARHSAPRAHPQTVEPTTAIVGRVVPAIEGVVITARDRELHLSAITDADGTFRIATEPGTYKLAAIADGYLPSVASATTSSPVEVRLVAGGFALSGTAADVSGGSVEGVKVATQLDGADLISFTDADGRYRMTLPSDDFTMHITHDDYVSQALGVVIGDTPRTLNLSMVPATVVQGVVVASDGGPIADAVIEVESRRGFDGDTATAVSDEQGHFIARIEAGQIQLDAHARGFASANSILVSDVSADIELRLDRAFAIRGRVVDDDGAGVAHLAITLTGNARQRTTTSDETGAFAFEGLLPGDYSVTGKSDDVRTTYESYCLMGSDIVDALLKSEARAAVDRRGQLTYDIDGRLEPAVPADVQLNGHHVRTDARGRFSIPDVEYPTGTIVALTDDRRIGTLEIEDGQALRGLVVRVVDGVRLDGTVVDEAGAPLAGRVVTAEESFTPTRRTTTDARGRFSFVGMLPGEIYVKTEESTDYDARMATRWGTVLVDTKTFAGELTLHSRSFDMTLHGIVRDDRGVPVEGARVESLGKPPTLTAADGTFVIHDVSKDYVPNAVVWAPNGDGFADVQGKSYDVPLEITLTRWYPLAGTVTRAGVPVTEFDIECKAELQAVQYKHVVARDGRFAFGPQPPGHHVCQVSSAVGPATGSVDIVNAPGHLALDVPHDLVVRGTLVSVLTGVPVVGARVEAPGARTTVPTDADGRFVLHQVPTSGTLRFWGEGISGDSEFTARDGEVVDLGTIAVVARPPGTEQGAFQLRDNRAITDVGPLAEAAGIRIGDEIRAIDGVSLPPETLWRVLDEGLVYQHAYRLTLARGDIVTLTASEDMHWYR